MFIAPDRDEHERKFDALAAEIDFDGDKQREKLRTAYLEAIFSGNFPPMHVATVVLYDGLRKESWRWPWLELWKARFEALSVQPYVWRLERRAFHHPDLQEKVSLDLDQYLFYHTLHASSQFFRPGALHPYAMLFSIHRGEPLEVQRISEKLDDDVREGRSSRLPPFYPGCRQSWMGYPESLVKYDLAHDRRDHIVNTVKLAGPPTPCWRGPF